MLKIIFIYFLLIAIDASVQGAADLFCSEDFCSFYIEKNECMHTSDACRIQNRTYSGELFPGEVPCGCCNVCLQNLREGDPCTIGSPDVTPPMLVCGPGLYCKQDGVSTEFTCQKMTHTECFREQIAYDEKKAAGLLGSFMQRPICDGDGNYLSAKCVLGQSCFCVNKNGKRIFGEAPYNTITEATMKCECSRLFDQFMSTMKFKYPFMTARCQEDGSFDPLQCMNGKCVCIEPDSGSPSSSVTVVTGSDYKRMPCFDRKMHLEYKYNHNCEEIRNELMEEIEAAQGKQFTVFGYEFPNCQPDGWFEAVQKDGAKLFCVDKYNQRIEEFEAQSGSQEAIEMNCKCARTRHLMRKQHSKYLPECTPNGNFKKVQCRGEICYCVDENGIQLTKETQNILDIVC
ncbi:uncharacterized protein LOC129952596 [Eupeodes corollae]|uniref:uncharacterized protein LOC129952596 n=1 Tax=Eupeodes corollae TaxID=290404 RepID=UPI0024910B96|nr:uncharacterized protein LOC129952596 [Eupeodes corollae]